MTISAFTAGTYFQDRNTANLVSQKARLETLTAQLTTGRNAETYGGIGSARTTSLSAHALAERARWLRCRDQREHDAGDRRQFGGDTALQPQRHRPGFVE